MKIAIVIPFFIGASSIASAQTTTPGTVPPVINPLTLELPAAGIRPVLPPQATLLAETAAGKAVALPQDNMPCLVPRQATAAVIPNAAKFVLPGNPIPNASRAHPVIPKH